MSKIMKEPLLEDVWVINNIQLHLKFQQMRNTMK